MRYRSSPHARAAAVCQLKRAVYTHCNVGICVSIDKNARATYPRDSNIMTVESQNLEDGCARSVRSGLLALKVIPVLKPVRGYASA